MARKPAAADSGGTNIPPPDTEEAMILSGLAKMDALEEVAVNARKAISRFRKEFSATTGIKLHVFDQARRERGLERKESVEDQSALMRLRRYLKLPVGSQTELFPADAPPPSQDAAYLDGFNKGIRGKGQRKPPEEFSSGKQQQSWLQGWDEGQAKLGQDFFKKKDYSKDPPPPKSGEAKGPSAKKEAAAGGEVVSLADKKAEKAASAPPTTPKAADKKDDTAAVVKRVADKKKAEKSAKTAPAAKDKAADKPADKPRTKAEEAAANGGVRMAPAGAQKGGGDFEDDHLLAKNKKPAGDGDDDFELDDDFDLEEEGAD